jgi:hypothetical protein
VQLAGIAFAIVPLTGGLVTLWRDRVGGPGGDADEESPPPEPEPILRTAA